MKLNCVSCGHAVDLRNSYDHYEGQVKCFACGTLLSIRTEDGQVRSVAYASSTPQISNSATQQATADFA
ncbi:MAG: hypothetical protein H8E44_44445 [Planctomycetes bacterium]|nr:hypothetical protein [Planctomycetota bacterium]